MGKSSIETAQEPEENMFLKIDLLGSNNNVVALFEAAAQRVLSDKASFEDSYIAKASNRLATFFVPLIFCASYEKLRSDGVNCPREFVIEQNDFYYREIDGKAVSGFSVLKRRLVYLRDQFKNIAVDERVLRDWFAGLFRKYCFQDEAVHGSSCLLDLSSGDPVGTCKKWLGTNIGASSDVKCFWQRFGCVPEGCTAVVDSLWIYQDIIRCLYKGEVRDIQEVIEAYRKQGDQIDDKQACSEKLSHINEQLPTAEGFAIKYTSPTLKFNILVIDDNAQDECDRLNQLAPLQGIFEFEAMELKGDDIINNACEKIEEGNTKSKTYDFALLDLSLGEKPESDLYGYQLIRLLHQFFPQMPVIIYSQFSDMGHIARAFRYGAKWFLKKSDTKKLLRHSLSILSLRDWRKEWNTVNRLGLCGRIEVQGPKDFTDEQKYLTYRCMEKLPGEDISVKVMGGGFSSAVTFRARKGAIVKGENLQDPIIIKIDTAFNTMTEYERYFRFIRPYIANESGRVESKEITLDHNNSAITYTFAGKNDSSRVLDTMKNMLAEDVRYTVRCDYKKYEAVFDEIFNDILPKIHRVSPKLESPISSYPNRIFGEKNTDGAGFIDNYLARIPLLCHFKVEEFVGGTTKGAKPFEVHGVKTEEGQKVIEAYSRHPYSKQNVILRGEVADYVARYRELKQGQTLWVKGGSADAVGMKLDSVALESLKSILYHDDGTIVTYYDGFDDKPFNETIAKDAENPEEQRNKAATECLLHLSELMAGVKLDEFAFESDQSHTCIVEKLYKNAVLLVKKDPNNQRFLCNVGIVHGDLNYANIMVDSKKDGTIDDAKDVWLIDFARTRRDIVAHDFNVIFTATFSQLFNNELWNDKGVGGDERYAARITRIFKTFINNAMFAREDEVPDYIAGDRRFTLFYKIFRRIRKAALDNMTEDMYALTTALCCLYTFKVLLKYEKNLQGAAALLATAHICIEHLKEAAKS